MYTSANMLKVAVAIKLARARAPFGDRATIVIM
jgi:hypothetical protein